MKKKDNSIKDINHKRICFHGLQLFLVQSTVCIIVIMLSFILKLVGGDSFSRISTLFHQGMFDDNLLTATYFTSTNDTVLTNETNNAENVMAVSVSNVSYDEEEDTFVCVAPFENGTITSLFGNRIDPITGDEGVLHAGVDIAAEKRTPIAAIMSGVVREVGYDEAGYGHYVIVSCDEQHEYLYAHCTEVTVVLEQQITAGEVIASVGDTGRATGDHLHFEWRENGIPIDPMSVLPEETYV